MTEGRRRLGLLVLTVLLVPLVLWVSGHLLGRKPERRPHAARADCDLEGKGYSQGALVRQPDGTVVMCRDGRWQPGSAE
jgi:hypothetical protein